MNMLSRGVGRYVPLPLWWTESQANMVWFMTHLFESNLMSMLGIYDKSKLPKYDFFGRNFQKHAPLSNPFNGTLFVDFVGKFSVMVVVRWNQNSNFGSRSLATRWPWNPSIAANFQARVLTSSCMYVWTFTAIAKHLMIWIIAKSICVCYCRKVSRDV